MAKISYGPRLGRSIGGMAIGLILFLSSFGVLYWNEGRVNQSDVAADATAISADEVADAELQGTQVAVSGSVSTDELLGDGMYIVPGEYLAISSTVEMFAWKEKSSTTTETNLGGSQETNTTYSYTTEWTGSPSDSSNFYDSASHQNPALIIDSVSDRVDSASIGMYELNFATLDLAGFEPLSLNAQVVTGVTAEIDVNADSAGTGDAAVDSIAAGVGAAVDAIDEGVNTVISGKYVYVGAGDMTDPQIGDIRISYKVIPNNIDATVIGLLDGDKITTYRADDTDIYRMFMGSKEDALSQLDTEYTTALWGFRIAGLLMMWIGLAMLLAPLTTALDVVPMFGSLGRGLVTVVTFIVSVILSVITIMLSKVLHNVWILIGGVVVIGAFILWSKKGRKGPIKKIKI